MSGWLGDRVLITQSTTHLLNSFSFLLCIQIMAQTVLVTGGAGFIGSHIVDHFLDAGYRVVALDNLKSGKTANVNPRAKFYEADIRDTEALDRIFAAENPAVISHQAALADVRESQRFPDLYAEVNVIGTIRLLEAARKHGARKFLMASTGGAIYGEQNEIDIPTSENANAQPIDPYGVSKLAAEHYMRSYKTLHGLDFCALRYGNVYGPRQNNEGEAGVIAIFTTRMLRGEPVTIYGDGLQERDFVFVNDVARANVAAAEQGSGIYNIGTSVASNINMVFRTLTRLTNYTHPEIHGSAKPGEVRNSCIATGKAARELNWGSQVSLVEGLAQTVTFFRG